MKTALPVVVAALAVLLEVPIGLAAPCKCESKSKKQLVARNSGECEVSYYKRIFTVESSSECSVKKFYENVFYQYEGESKQDYVNRIDVIFGQVYTNLDCRFDTGRKDFLSSYYKYKFCKNSGENDEEYFERVLTKTSESECNYKNKVKLIKKFVKNVDWDKVKIEEKTKKGFSIISAIKSKKSCGTEDKKKKEVKKEQKQKKSTDKSCNCQEDSNKAREVEEKEKSHKKNVEEVERKKREHEENVKKLEDKKREHEENVKKVEAKKREHEENVKKVQAKKREHEENVKKVEAKKREHEENVKNWIKANYCRKSGEDIKTYYKRICTKTTSDEEYLERITIARSLFPDLDLWYSEEYLSEVSGYYTLFFSKKSTESEEEYFKRLVVKESYESDLNCAKRIHLLHSLFPSLSLWYEEKYYEQYTKAFYQSFYKQVEGESNEVYLRRVFTKLSGESEDNFWFRIKLVQKTFPDYKCWYEKENLKKLEVCRSVSEAKNEEDLKKRVEKENKGGNGSCQAKIDCLQIFFKSSSSKSSSKTSESREEESSESFSAKAC